MTQPFHEAVMQSIYKSSLQRMRAAVIDLPDYSETLFYFVNWFEDQHPLENHEYGK